MSGMPRQARKPRPRPKPRKPAAERRRDYLRHIIDRATLDSIFARREDSSADVGKVVDSVRLRGGGRPVTKHPRGHSSRHSGSHCQKSRVTDGQAEENKGSM